MKHNSSRMLGMVMGIIVAMLIAICLHKHLTGYRLIIKKPDANSIMRIFLDDALKHKRVVPSVLYSGILSTEGISKAIQDHESLDSIVNLMNGYFKLKDNGCFEDKYGNVLVMEMECYDNTYVGMRFEVYEGLGAFLANKSPLHVTKKYHWHTTSLGHK